MGFCFVGANDVIKRKNTKSPKFGGYSYLQIWGKKKGICHQHIPSICNKLCIIEG